MNFSPASKKRRIREHSYERSSDFSNRAHYGAKNVDYRNDKFESREKDYRDGKDIDENEWFRRQNVSRSRSTSPVAVHRSSINSKMLRKRFYSPLDKRSVKQHKRSRSRSPRSAYNSLNIYMSTTGNGREFINNKSRSKSNSPSSKIRRIDLKEKIVDTSLFAELVKDKHKRDKTLKEILEKKNDLETPSSCSLPNQSTLNDDSNLSNGFNNNSNNIHQSIDIVNIPIPETADSTFSIDKNMMYSMNNKYVPDNAFENYVLDSSKNAVIKPKSPVDHAPVDRISVDRAPGDRVPVDRVLADRVPVDRAPFDRAPVDYAPVDCTSVDRAQVDHVQVDRVSVDLAPVSVTIKQQSNASLNDQSSIKNNDKQIKCKSLTKLPMPPGINPSDLDDIKSPTSPDSISPVHIKTNTNKKHSEISKKKGLLDLPMPYQTGFDELSGDEDAISPKYIKSATNSSPVTLRKRPQILHRKSSLNSNQHRDWGERCVDVFEVIAQIGEGTYGQVRYRILKL